VSFLKDLFGGGEKRIRKDAGELQLADLEQFPAWEFCLDEEEIEGQTECTMRPARSGKRVKWPTFYGIVATDMIAANGRRFVGLVQPGESMENPWCCSPEIVLSLPIGKMLSHPALDRYNQMVSSDSPRIALHVPAMSPEEVRVLVPLAYRAMNIRAEELWPLTVRPRVPIEGFPESWKLDGWLNASRHDPRCVLE